MNQKSVNLILIIGLILFLSISLVSASWLSDFWNKITGTGQATGGYLCSNGQRIGDVNGDGVINNLDSNLVLNIDAGLVDYPINICCADVNKDGSIQSADALLIMRITAGTSSSPGTCETTPIPVTTCRPTITATALENGIVGTSYSITLAASGPDYDSYSRYCKPYYWYISEGSLPPGLGLSENGIIRGTPTSAGTYTFTVAATDQYLQQTATQSFTIAINQVTIPFTSSPFVTLTANPTVINSGENSTLTWNSINATSCNGTGFSTNGATFGSQIVYPANTTIYSLTCSNPSSSTTKFVTVIVNNKNSNYCVTDSECGVTSNISISACINHQCMTRKWCNSNNDCTEEGNRLGTCDSRKICYYYADPIEKQKILFILMNKTHQGSLPVSEAKRILLDGTNKFLSQVSGGRSSIDGDFIGWYTYDETTLYKPDLKETNTNITEVQRLASQNGINAYDYPIIVLVINGIEGIQMGTVATPGSLGYPMEPSWISITPIGMEWTEPFNALNKYNPNLASDDMNSFKMVDESLAHELGHALGLYHAMGLSCPNNDFSSTACKFVDYGNFYDFMGTGECSTEPNIAFRDLLGWISKEEIKTISSSGTYHINPLEKSGGIRGAKIILPGETKPAYYLEYRQPIGFDQYLLFTQINSTRGLMINEIYTPKESKSASLLLYLNIKQDYYLKCSEGTLLPGQTFSDNKKGIYITTISSNEAGIDFNVTINNQNISPNNKIKSSSEKSPACNGCSLNGNCYTYNSRKDGNYCSASGIWLPQKQTEGTCTKNSECSSLICSSGKCNEGGFVQKIIAAFREAFS